MKRFSRPSRKSDHSISIHNTFPQLLHHYFITFFVTLLIVESRIESSEAFCSWQKPMNNFLNAQKSRKSTVKYVWSFLRIRERSEITKVNASGKGQRRNAKRWLDRNSTRDEYEYIYICTFIESILLTLVSLSCELFERLKIFLYCEIIISSIELFEADFSRKLIIEKDSALRCLFSFF